jgi:hypothetical protein
MQLAARSSEEASAELAGPMMNAEARVTWGEASSGLGVSGWGLLGIWGSR